MGALLTIKSALQCCGAYGYLARAGSRAALKTPALSG